MPSSKPSPDIARASARGYLVQPWRPARGTVLHAYGSAVNLRLGDAFVTMLPERAPDGPTTIRIAHSDWHLLANVQPSTPAVARAGLVRVGTVLVDARSARVWRPPARPGRTAVGLAGRAAALAHRAVVDGGAPWISGALRDCLAATPAQVPDAVRRIVGRGVGLTPAGDDALVGALCVLWSMTSTRPMLATQPAPATFRHLTAAITLSLDRTNDLSAEFLRLGCDGHFHRPLQEAVAALISGSADEPDKNQALLAVGATSGADAALGVVAAINFIINSAKDRAAA